MNSALAAVAAPGTAPKTKKELVERFRKAHELMDVDALMELVNGINQPETVFDHLRGRFSESVKFDLSKATLEEGPRGTELKLVYQDAAKPAASFTLESREGAYLLSPPASPTPERVAIRTKMAGPQGAPNDGELLTLCRTAHEQGRADGLLELVYDGPKKDIVRGLIQDGLLGAKDRSLLAVEVHPVPAEKTRRAAPPWRPYARLNFRWGDGSTSPELSKLLVVTREGRRFLAADSD